ncbi:MBL fold metallo-hydrolase [Labrys monachus]|uniref:L-ascorbate metabolism protein UlaG (Beta-lactamase superfamily) n=1 Tax=Labrys monachus TaxID=217067 RepID=A0ABU0F991_9HYPH|nr:MBL fold metallo-hydrolase [Labrys monachus]MDQ0391181.1 L-ascorbate metabolism protein UlaG (beta-lactamase superfamily) [Labrys monachus]
MAPDRGAWPSFEQIPYDGPLAARLATRPAAGGLSLYWLGQAGFVLDTGQARLLIDPYLSDALAVKYRGRGFSHERMMPPPIGVDDLPPIDAVLCTHHHTDHMDGETLQRIAARCAGTRFVVPLASLALARERIGAAPGRLVGVDAGDGLDLAAGLRLSVMRAAHETLERDAAGRHVFLGYGLEADGLRVFHSGDTVPFEGQAAEIAAFRPDLALFPVNGRSDALRSAGIAGNFTLDETADLARECRVPVVMAHHYGMFAFNSAAPEAIDARARGMTGGTRLVRARTGVEYRLGKDPVGG